MVRRVMPSRKVWWRLSAGAGLLWMSASCSHQTQLHYATSGEAFCSRISPTQLDAIFGTGFVSDSIGRGDARACSFSPTNGDTEARLAEAFTTGGGVVVEHPKRETDLQDARRASPSTSGVRDVSDAFESVEGPNRAVLYVLDHDALISVRLNHPPNEPAPAVQTRLVALYRVVAKALRTG